jgi:hypothetical protein
MSANTATDLSYLHRVNALKKIIEDLMEGNALVSGPWRDAETEEERNRIETEILGILEQVLDSTYEYRELSWVDILDKDDIDTEQYMNLYRLEVTAARLKSIIQQYIDYFNLQQTALLAAYGALRRIRQKRAALKFWNKEECKWAFTESFLNLDGIDSKKSGQVACSIDTVQGVCTLPVLSRAELRIASLKIDKGSNGVPGNSDLVVQTNNNQIRFLLDNDPATWFEYEKLDSGPLYLNLKITLVSEAVVNALTIWPASLSTGYQYEVVDIFFNRSGKETVSLRETLRQVVPDDFFIIKSSGNDSCWTVSFLPVTCTSISIRLQQKDYYLIDVFNRDLASSKRHRYAIGLKGLGVLQCRYAKSGSLSSKAVGLPSNLYAFSCQADIFPKNEILCAVGVGASTDSGNTWSNDLLELPQDVGPLSLVRDNSTELLWNLSLERKDSAFSSVSSLTGEALSFSVDSILRTALPTHSPLSIALPSKPLNGEVHVIQPKVMRRLADKQHALRIGTGTDAGMIFRLPASLPSLGIEPDELVVYVNGEEWTPVDDESALDEGFYFLANDQESISFDYHLPEKASVKVGAKEEMMLLEERSDGYYCFLKEAFDPTPETITIHHLPAIPLRVSTPLPRGRTVIPLGYKYLDEDNFSITTELGTTYTAVADRASLVLDTDYYLDPVSGILYLKTALPDATRAIFPHSTPSKVRRSDIEVVFDGAVPVGVRISRDALQLHEQTDTAKGTLKKRLNVVSGTMETRTDTLSTSTYGQTLSYTYVVKGTVSVGPELMGYTSDHTPPEELEFVDGHSEFLGLKQMNEEYTSETAADAFGRANFKLSAGAAWYSKYNAVFSDTTYFATLMGSLAGVTVAGRYYIDPATGDVAVYVGVGGTLPADIQVQYSYRDPDYDSSNKFSVDYERGHLYTSEPISSGVPISYKAASYKMGYDIGLVVEGWTLDEGKNIVTVPTESLSPINGLVKVMWACSTAEEDMTSLSNFFSPILYGLTFRFQ